MDQARRDPSCRLNAGTSCRPARSGRSSTGRPCRPCASACRFRCHPRPLAGIVGCPPHSSFGTALGGDCGRLGSFLVTRQVHGGLLHLAHHTDGISHPPGKNLPADRTADPATRLAYRPGRIVTGMARLSRNLGFQAVGGALPRPHANCRRRSDRMGGHRHALAQLHVERAEMVGHLARLVGGTELSHHGPRLRRRHVHRTSW
ncbi:Hypothetical protein PFR_JS25-2_14 [Propionibacterium freudenreichii]|nr:Hypothetical protein PFR_JS25-2_14 [Propionibacterium freudenreichii]